MHLFAPVEELKGIGPKTAETLKKYGIRTVRDFFYNLPRDYENYEKPVSISDIRPGKVVIRGKIDNISMRRARKRNLSIVEGIISDQTGSIKVVWFNQSYRTKQFSPDKEYYFTGNYEFKNGRYSLISPSAALVSDIDPSAGLNPIYVAHGSLKSSDFKRLVTNSRDKFNEIPDFLPSVPKGVRKSALFYIHFPNSLKNIQKSRDYLAYEELFELILAAKLNRRENEKLKASKIPINLDEIKEFIKNLPFTLTAAQKKAIWEILQDTEKPTPMNRLLQGDVGSGKTIVAAISAYNAILSGAQVAMLAPTAILATQHFENLKKLLEKPEIKTVLLTGATKNKSKLKKDIKEGKIDFVIGTHALLTDDTEFKNLGLVIIDEQHRFGVEQRQKLALKSPAGLAPHLLAMTATPIPRSLQLTVFGDLSVSILNQLPKGRQPITTHILSEIEMREKLYPVIYDTLKSKQQIYWVCKSIDDNPKSETTSVKSRSEKLKREFKKATMEFLHGRMKPAEKDEIMERFSRGKIDILVSTTVIEVGVDVPNASLMIIENAEMYGLAQLHQLRGRVGRGSTASYCYLLTPGESRPTRRLLELEKSSDGFYLAEVDLKMRGPGEIYGSLQHGALDLRIATLTDTKLINRAQNDVAKFLENPENLLKWKELMQGITKYQQITTLN
ncbi:ATP-dependent DNA helicase RecG [Candidatus Saccharibacteria bacterium]|nr:ATP-dependent DNA helicase RecG [Candidatus Saccharibacteria bacterium]